MGMYGHKFDKLLKHEDSNTSITLEIYVCSELYNQILEEGLLLPLQENLKAKVTLKDSKKSIELDIRDIKTMARSGDKGQHGTSIKVTQPSGIVGKRGVDIIVPSFEKTGEAPYKGEKVPGTFKKGITKAYIDPKATNATSNGGTIPAELDLAIKFATEFQKELNLIYYKPENEYNQVELLKQIIRKCDYIEKVSVNGNVKYQEEINKEMEKKDNR